MKMNVIIDVYTQILTLATSSPYESSCIETDNQFIIEQSCLLQEPHFRPLT